MCTKLLRVHCAAGMHAVDWSGDRALGWAEPVEDEDVPSELHSGQAPRRFSRGDLRGMQPVSFRGHDRLLPVIPGQASGRSRYQARPRRHGCGCVTSSCKTEIVIASTSCLDDTHGALRADVAI
jgi:hypothetical protein